ncbi:MAG: DUF1156 domain-containing protein [Dehalococcoidia bacterium]|nr:DUF1156 domain-containing protein [Dehalococcoidia bacterium]
MNPKRLIEEWLPIKEIGVESRRENSTGLHPPPNRLHVWWARRPLTASRAAILGSLLPAWDGNGELLDKHFSDEDEYHSWFLQMLGILGDPVGAEILLRQARERNIRIPNPNRYPRAFTIVGEQQDFETFKSILAEYLGTNSPVCLDPMSGGGSIPFETMRLGLTTLASELNPVASVVLKATVDYPLSFGASLSDEIQYWGNRIKDVGTARLDEFFPEPDPSETVMSYIWARTVPCPTTGKPVPLSPNWWLRRKTGDSVAVHMLPCDEDWDECRFEIVRGRQSELERRYAPSQGTIRRGNAVSPWSGDPVPGDYIKQVAQSGGMGAQLFALCVNRGSGRDYRLPTDEDIAAVGRAEAALAERWDDWLADGLVPNESIPLGNKTAEPRRYGMDQWHKLFAPRQLLAMLTYLETLREITPEMESELGKERADAVRAYLAFALDKCANWNAILASWNAPYQSLRSVFDRHDFAMKWSFAEMNMALKDKGAFPWALEQVVDSYKGLCDLVELSRPLFDTASGTDPAGAVQVSRENAARISHLQDASVDAVVVDPPYGNNVMYAELSDFFYVWLKRSVGDIYPGWFDSELVDKDAEAVANPARFEGVKAGQARDMATRDYLLKMRRVFREMRRVVKPTGSMTVMFTHRETEMWNALGLALLETGWEIGSSWPVQTESGHTLNIAQKNSARSTVFLFCRPRELARQESFWTRDLQDEVRQTARQRAREFQQSGIKGVDLHLSTFGPVLGVLSRHWPVVSEEVDRETGEPLRLEPEEALRIARAEIFGLQREGLLDGRAANWDAATDWYLLAWKSFGAREFSYDEARMMAMAHGTDADELRKRHKLLSRKKGSVVFLQPGQREGRDHVNPDAVTFPRMVDALHTAMWLYDMEGDQRCRQFLQGAGLISDPDFSSLVRAAINAIPRSRKYSRGEIVGFNVPEAQILENMRISLFPDIEVNEELDINTGAEQAELILG